jgi:hypothetical protein
VATNRGLLERRPTGDVNLRDALQRDQHPSQPDTVRASRRRVGQDANVLEATEADEMIDRLAHALHRQWFADTRFDQLQNRRVCGHQPAELDANVEQRAAEKVAHIGHRVGAREQRKDDREEDPHQNKWRLRTSKA